MKYLFHFLSSICVLYACTPGPGNDTILPEVPEGVQAISLLGNELRASRASEAILQNYDKAKNNFEAQPDNPDLLIWYGRWTAYKGDYREAIRIFTEGILAFPDDARMYRHRGHRYISIRCFDRAIKDFQTAEQMIIGKKDEVEPDGMPNARNIPVSTLHTNIYYHLGLAYYLSHDLQKALQVYQKGVAASDNDDMLVAHIHWLYMTLQLLEKEDEAKQALAPIHTDMNVIENVAYYQLCLMYKGLIDLEDLTGDAMSDTMSDALKYGIGNWYLYHGGVEKAEETFSDILRGEAWSSFGYIAAETYLSSQLTGDF